MLLQLLSKITGCRKSYATHDPLLTDSCQDHTEKSKVMEMQGRMLRVLPSFKQACAIGPVTGGTVWKDGLVHVSFKGINTDLVF